LVRIAGSYHAPWDIQVASSYTFQSGPYSGPVINRIAAPDPAFGPPTVTLSNGRVVPNPLATVFRFAGATRGDGQVKLDPVHTWNIRAGRMFEFGRVRVEPSVDVLSVLNTGSFYAFQLGANQTFNPAYGQGQSIQPPRALQLSVRVLY
jgi:hypothetical protein